MIYTKTRVLCVLFESEILLTPCILLYIVWLKRVDTSNTKINKYIETDDNQKEGLYHNNVFSFIFQWLE